MILNSSKIKFSRADLNKKLILPERITPELAEETGLHIGDGSMNFYFNKGYYVGKYSLRGHISDDIEHYDIRIKKLYHMLYNFNPNLKTMKSTGVYGFQLWTDCIVAFKNKILTLPLGNKKNIKIPHCLVIKKEYIVSVLRGIFDTDGCIYLEPKNHRLYPRVQIGTTSRILAEQLKKNLFRLGFRVTKFMENREHKGWNNLYIISVRGDKMLRKWMEVIEPRNPKYISKFEYYLKNS